MYKLLVVLIAAVLLSLGLAYPELILQEVQTDSVSALLNDDALPHNPEMKQIVPEYDVPRPDGEPLPPPPDDDEDEEMPPRGGGN